MRLWHSKLIPLLDGKRLCDLHMSCCNLRGNGWGKRNAAVGYLYEDPLGEDALAAYHMVVLDEMLARGYMFDPRWCNWDYCGKNRPPRHVEDRGPGFLELLERDVPLKGHTEDIYLNDVKALQDRAVQVNLFKSTACRNDGYWTTYVARVGNVTTIYCVKISEETNDD